MNASAGFTALVALVRKDVFLYFSNRRSLIMSIAAPIVIAGFFGSVFGSGNDKPSRIPIALTDLDGSAVSRKIDAALQADATLEVRPHRRRGCVARRTPGQGARCARPPPPASERRRRRPWSATAGSRRSTCASTHPKRRCCPSFAACSRST